MKENNKCITQERQHISNIFKNNKELNKEMKRKQTKDINSESKNRGMRKELQNERKN